MTTKYPKFMLSGVIAENGDYSLPQAEKPSNGRFSISKGFDVENSLPLDQGGIPPFRQDFNGMAYLLSQFLVWYQQGGLMNYSASLDYEEGNEINHKGKKWRCVKANGKNSKLVEPSTNSDYWREASASHIAGEVVAFANVRLGGSDGRRPIFWGESSASEGWVLCDGGSDGRGGNVPNLIGRCVEGTNPNQSGSVSGGISFSTSGVPIGAVIHMAGNFPNSNDEYLKLGNAFELKKSEYPEVSKILGNTWGNASTSTKFKTPDVAGRYIRISGDSDSPKGQLGYREDAGLPNITGSVKIYQGGIPSAGKITGAFYSDPDPNETPRGWGGEGAGSGWSFDASRSNRIYGSSDTVTPKSAVFDAYLKVKNLTKGESKTAERYSLAYFVKLPE